MKQNYKDFQEDIIVTNIEQAIQNQKFSSKEKLIEYLLEIQKKEILKDKTKLEKLLNLYDNLYSKTNSSLDMSQYESVSTENKDLIVSKNEERVLNTTKGASQYANEFHSVQNSIIASNSHGQVNSNDVFDHMAKYQKEELNLISIEDAISKNNIEIEILNKIKFFITNINIDIQIFKVDITTGIFYNKETDEIYEVRKNNITNQFEIYKGSNRLHNSNETNTESETANQTLTEVDPAYETDGNELNKPKTRVKKLDNPLQNRNNAAFANFGFIIINILSFVFLTAMIILLNK